MTRKPKNIEGLSLKKSSLVFILLLLIAVLAIFFLWWRWANLPFDGDDTSAGQTFIVGKGESLSSVAFRLQDEGLIRSGVAFKLLGRMRNLEEKIQTGSFRLKPSQTLQEIIEFLTQGTQDIWLTFPEGWRREEFARRLVNNLENFDQEEFLALTADHEGELFPDTYLLPREASASAVFQFLQGNFQRRFDDDLINQASKAGLSQPEVLILASLVEREAKHEKDRPIVAGILLKRLAAGWPLQVDATMQYALANLRCSQGEDDCNWWLPPTAADKKIDSPYNTYIHKGLPPAPICNPGLSTIKAVIYSQDSEYWFYISDLKGNMHYGRTVEEHNANIQKYLQ
jgi:UPF0755 protein